MTTKTWQSQRHGQWTVWRRLLWLMASCAVLLLGGWAARPTSAIAAPRLQAAGPSLIIPDNILSGPASTVRVPIQLDPAGQRVSGIAFPINYDESCLALDTTDANGDGSPDSIQFGAPGAFTKSVSVRPNDPNTELIFVIADYSQPISTLDAGALVTITFTTRCAPPQGETIYAPVHFAALPLPSFGNPGGRAIDGSVQGGGVLIGDSPIIEPTATPTTLPTATATPSPTPSPTSTGTPPPPTATPSPTSTFTPSPTPTPIVGGNVAPVAHFDAGGTLQGQPVAIDPLANDRDGNADPLTLVTVADPAGGAVQVDPRGRLTYTPDAGFTGFDSFTYVTRDPSGASSLGYVGVVVSSKRNHGLPPAMLLAEPGREVTAAVTISQGTFVALTLPADPYAPPIAEEDIFFLAYLNWLRPAADVKSVLDGLRYANRGFTLQAYVSQRAKPDAILAAPLRVTLHYDDAELAGLDESAITLRRWDADQGGWSDTGIVVISRDSVHNQIATTVARPGEYAFFAAARSEAGRTIYLPLIFQQEPGNLYLSLIFGQPQQADSSNDSSRGAYGTNLQLILPACPPQADRTCRPDDR